MTARLTCLVLVGCHSAGVAVEHRGAGGVELDHQFMPRLGRDQHYISFPAHPFVNCIDVVAFDGDAKEHKPHNRTHDVACSDSARFADFVGYRTKRADPEAGVDASWITDGTDALFGSSLTTLEAALGKDITLSEPKAEFSFLHFSDIQIREPAAKLTSASATLDKVVGTFERDYEQELYSRYTYASIIDTVNAELPKSSPSRPAPQFMIHTGDSVDAGLKSEFDEFLANSNRLHIPWYQAVGNHDVLAFGNLKLYSKNELAKGQESESDSVLDDADCTIGNEECSCTQVADLLRDVEYAKDYDNLGEPIGISSFQQLASIAPSVLRRICIRHRVRNDRFIMNPTDQAGNAVKASNAFLAAHCQRSSADNNAGCIPHHLAADRYASVAPSQPCGILDGGVPKSMLHGFDLYPVVKQQINFQNAEAIRTDKDYVRAYYCFQAAKLDGRNVWAVVLDTNAKNGAYGDVSIDQLEWLEKTVLATTQIKKTDLVLLFGHHPMGHIFSDDRRNKLLGMIGADERVIAYFTGHTHAPELRVIHGHPQHHHVWEVVAPSVITFPQQVRQVTMKTLGDDIGYFEILTFAPQGYGPSADKVALAIAGAQRDSCKTSKECENGAPKAISRTMTYPRLFFRLPKSN